MQKKSVRNRSTVILPEWQMLKSGWYRCKRIIAWLIDHTIPTLRQVRISERSQQMGMFLVGAQGRGKSELLKHILWQYVHRYRWASVVLLDPHGEMAKQIARWRLPTRLDRIEYLEFGGAASHSPSIDFLSDPYKSPEQLFWQARFYGAALEVISDQEYTPLMQSLCTNCLHVLIEKPQTTLYDLLRFLDVHGSGNDLATYGAQRSCNPVVRSFFADYGKDTLKATRKALYSRIQMILASPALQQILLRPTSFDLDKMTRQRRIVVCDFGALDTHSTQLLGQLLSAKVQLIAQKRRPALEYIHQYPPIHLIMDEAQNFVSELTVTQINELRKCRLHLTLATQDVSYLSPRLLNAALSLGVLAAGNCEGKSLAVMTKALGMEDIEVLQGMPPGDFIIMGTRPPGSRKTTRPRWRCRVPKWLLFDVKYRRRNRRRYWNDQAWQARRRRFNRQHAPKINNSVVVNNPRTI